ncbi:MAG: hypothetical protein Q8904_03985 [Bacteroidota bacterium]|nr:hypothetical protein [Bacteroidota bacterium]
MKKGLFFFVVFSMISLSMFSQEVNHKSYAFCELVGTGNLLGTKVTVSIDFGQKKSFFQSNVLLDAEGKPIKFNSMIDAMNSMGSKGWEFVQAFVVSAGSGTYSNNVYHYVLKKEVTAAELNIINSKEEQK